MQGASTFLGVPGDGARNHLATMSALLTGLRRVLTLSASADEVARVTARVPVSAPAELLEDRLMRHLPASEGSSAQALTRASRGQVLADRRSEVPRALDERRTGSAGPRPNPTHSGEHSEATRGRHMAGGASTEPSGAAAAPGVASDRPLGPRRSSDPSAPPQSSRRPDPAMGSATGPATDVDRRDPTRAGHAQVMAGVAAASSPSLTAPSAVRRDGYDVVDPARDVRAAGWVGVEEERAAGSPDASPSPDVGRRELAAQVDRDAPRGATVLPGRAEEAFTLDRTMGELRSGFGGVAFADELARTLGQQAREQGVIVP